MSERGELIFGMTGVHRVTGGIARSNVNNLYSLVDLAARKKLGLRVLSFLEGDSDRPDFLPEWVNFEGFRRSKFRFTAKLILLSFKKPIFVFDHVKLALPLLSFAAAGVTQTIIFAHGSEAWRRMQITSRWSFQSASLCLTNSKFTLRKMRERMPHFNGVACPLGLSPDFQAVTPPPEYPPKVDYWSFGPNSGGGVIATPSEARGKQSRLQLEAADQNIHPLGRRVLLLVARMDSREGRKGHRALIKILPDLLRKFPDVQLVFPGPGDDSDNLKKLAQSQGVARAVFIPGWVSPSVLRSLYQHCYALVMPSQQEGFGLVYLEAMNYAKPCVGCFDQGAEEIIVPGETGYLVRDPNNSEELLGVLTALLENPQRAEAFGRKGFERLHQHFTAQHYQERVKTEIARVLSTNGQRASH